MKPTFLAKRWLAQLNVPMGLLMVFLQRSPAIRAVTSAVEYVLASPSGSLLKSSVAAAATLGGIHTIAGATELSPSTPSPAQLTVGTNTNVAFGVTGTLGDATSWNVSGNVPPGMTFQGGKTSGNVAVGTLILSGTPTTAGNYTVNLVARYDPLSLSSPTFNYSFNVTGPANAPPSITTQPQSQAVTAGTNVMFTGGANGTPAPTFQWRKNGNDIPGQTGTTLTLNNVQAGDAADYTFVATNSAGSATSNAATLTVNAAPSAPSFTQQPSNQTVTAGNSVTFTASANGNPAPSYQWQKNGVNIGGATNSSYTINPVQLGDAGNYTVVASNSQGNVTSNIATLTVNPAGVLPSFTQQPASQTVNVGQSATFTAAANGTPAPTYQWKKDGVVIPGATNATYQIASTVLGDAGSYTVVAANSVGSVTSTAAALTVLNRATVGDIDGDRKADLIWQNRITGERSFWLMNGTAFGTGFAFWTVDPSWQMVGSGDFDADGKNDLVWTNTLTGERSIWLMNGTTFGSGISLGTVPLDWQIVATGDLNADGNADLVWQNVRTGEGAFWLMNGGAFTGATLSTQPTNRQVVATGDFNADGKTDLVWTDSNTGERFVWMMNGTTFVSEASLGVVPKIWQIVGSADYNGDGKSDLVWTNIGTGERTIWLMDGVTHTSTVTVGTVTIDWMLGRTQAVPAPVQSDFTGDANSDLIWQNLATGERALWVMNGTSFSSGVTLSTIPTDWKIVASGDFNADGKSDIVWANTTTGERSFWLMNGTSFNYGIGLGTIPTQWQIVASGDFNGDGKSDLVWSNTITGERSIWLMNGTSYTAGVALTTVPTNWQIVATGDFNADGKSDLVWTDNATGERVVWLMDGTSFVSGTSLGIVPTSRQIVGTGDFNADGKSDLVWTDTATGERSIWLMDGTNHSSTVSLGFIPTEWQIRN